MNPRVVAIIAGVITTALGLAGLLYPDRVMGVLGFAILNSANTAAVMGEVRATYGGLFVVLGVYTLLTAMDPAAHRSRLRFIGLLWLGACAGRLFGVNVNGNPGLPGWIALAFELLMGGALVAASLTVRPAEASRPIMTPTAQPAPPVTSQPANPPASTSTP
jgi:drug/metabolite transporter superfamily protein YnfA